MAQNLQALAAGPDSGAGNAGAPRWARAILAGACLALWFATQALLGARESPEGRIRDVLHEWTAPLHARLRENPRWADRLLVASSACIDLTGMSLLALGVLGRSFRPFVALVILFGLRQSCQALTALPTPEGMIWRDPGFPSMLVTYGVANDLFFSGHTGLAALGAWELARLRRPALACVGLFLVLFEASTVLILRAHYTMDVFAGLLAAFFAAIAAARLGPGCDAWLGRRLRR